MLGGTSRQQIEKLLFTGRICVRCGQYYEESENLGTWRCRALHPMEAYRTAHDKRYRCCGRDVESPGCVPADHTSGPEWTDEPVTLSEQLVEVAQQYQKTHPRVASDWIYDKDKRRWRLHRVDPHAYRSVLN